jgi:hypothetical protein
MKKGLLALVTVLVFVLLLASFTEVSADPNRPIECSVNMDWNGSYWAGTIEECILEGSIRFDPDPANPSYVVGDSLHFFELFTIQPDSGGVISGTDAGFGHMNQPPFQFLANGWITDVTGPWTSLIGNKYFERGLASPTTDPNLPLHIENMVLRIIPAQRP